MPQTGLWLRVFVGLLIAVIPVLVVLAAVFLVGRGVLLGTNPGLVGTAVVLATAGWCAALGIVFARSLGEEFSGLLTLAQRGGTTAPDGSSVQQQLATLLDERNSQVATLAQQASTVEIEEPPNVVRSLASAAGSLVPHSTWRCAVLVSEDPALLPIGIYHDLGEERETEPIGDLERWASTVSPDETAAHASGPWGAFTIVRVSGGGENRAILFAPWEGRVPPTRAELDLLTLLAQHTATSIEHSLLYGRVRSQADELNRLAAVQADFLRGVTHDLQTPLTSIAAVAGELKAGKGLSRAAREDLDTIGHQADRLRRMVSQLLVASRLEAGALTPQTDVFAVPPIIERTWAALRADRPFELKLHGAPQLAVADADRLEQVLWAILDNAVKYSPQGSAIGASVEADDGHMAIAIRDSGQGMDAEARSHAFDQFYRSEQARRAAPDGSGVGLYAARGLVEAMGGTISIDSQLGSGTTITLRIPAEPAEQTE